MLPNAPTAHASGPNGSYPTHRRISDGDRFDGLGWPRVPAFKGVAAFDRVEIDQFRSTVSGLGSNVEAELGPVGSEGSHHALCVADESPPPPSLVIPSIPSHSFARPSRGRGLVDGITRGPISHPPHPIQSNQFDTGLVVSAGCCCLVRVVLGRPAAESFIRSLTASGPRPRLESEPWRRRAASGWRARRSPSRSRPRSPPR